MVHLPWSVKTWIEEISLDDGAFVEAVRPKKKLMAFGDSITQGFDALHPAKRYVATLCESFFSLLAKKYTESKIFALSPLWRSDKDEKRAFGAFEDVEKDIREAVENIPNITFISGFDLIPHDIQFFADYGLHPNDERFAHFAGNVYPIQTIG